MRHITQDDAHIFCTEEQIADEVNRCLDFGYAIYDTFGFEPRLELSTRPEKRIGTEEMWDRAEAALESALVERGVEYELNAGDGAFYGPKIDLHMTDSIGRSWQLGTVQLDYVMPERFELDLHRRRQRRARPVMIHRALMGSFERFMGILIEHYAGEFPLWLAPLQALVLPVADRHVEYARAGRASGSRPPACARASTTAASRSGARSATPSSPRCPTCSWSATARPRRATAALRRHREGDLGTLPLDEIAAAPQRRAQSRRDGRAGSSLGSAETAILQPLTTRSQTVRRPA